MKIGKARFIYEVEFELELNFYFHTSHVFTISKEIYLKEYPMPIFDGIEIENNDNIFCYLVIDSTYELYEYDNVTEGSAKSRPQLLVIQGILAFLTDRVFITSYCINSQYCVTGQHIVDDNSQQIMLKANNKKLSIDLFNLLLTIKNSDEAKKILIYTLLERFRKALHFEELSTENLAYIDESTLAYVHILEILSEEFKDNLDIKIKEERAKLITEIISEAKTCDIIIPSKKIKSLLNTLNTNQVTLKSKIIQMLKDLSIYNEKTELIVSRFIEHRNSIAHGRKNLYQDKLIFPLKPFFSFIKDIHEQPIAIKLLASACISKYMNLKIWQKEWKQYLWHCEITPLSSVKLFLSDKIFEQITDYEFISGKVNSINPTTLVYYYIKNKVSLNELELSLSKIINTSRKTKKTCFSLFDACIILSDSMDITLATNAQSVIKKAYKKRKFPYSNVRDAIKEMKYNNITTEWFEKWMQDGKK